jgi:hypothetical protein
MTTMGIIISIISSINDIFKVYSGAFWLGVIY